MECRWTGNAVNVIVNYPDRPQIHPSGRPVCSKPAFDIFGNARRACNVWTRSLRFSDVFEPITIRFFITFGVYGGHRFALLSYLFMDWLWGVSLKYHSPTLFCESGSFLAENVFYPALYFRIFPFFKKIFLGLLLLHYYILR